VKGVNPQNFFEMYGKIIRAASSEIDLVPLENIREHFADSILKKGKLIYGK
jgi:hypothetical protein